MADYIVADSGQREEFASGMVRDIPHDKGAFELISPLALRRLALVYERGAKKYDERNWEKGAPLGRFIQSAMRHINDYLLIALYKRQNLDLAKLPPDVNPNEDHLAQAAWNLFAAMQIEDCKPELNNLSGYNYGASTFYVDNPSTALRPESQFVSGRFEQLFTENLINGIKYEASQLPTTEASNQSEICIQTSDKEKHQNPTIPEKLKKIFSK